MNRKLEQFFPIRLVNKPDTSCAAALYKKLFMKEAGNVAKSGIKLRRVKRLPNVEEFMENMKKI